MSAPVGRDEEIARLTELLDGLARIDVRVWSALDLLAESDPVLVVLACRSDAGPARNHPPAHRDVDWGLLSEREQQIADLVGGALTNQQIAHRIGRSPHTVNYHLRQIFRKLDITSRVELASLRQRHEAGGAGPRAAHPSSPAPHSVAPRSPAP